MEKTWEKIVKVEAERWDDELGLPAYEMIWIVTENGDVYSRSLEIGDTCEFLVRHYTKRGYIDGKCRWFNSLSASKAAR